MRPDTDRGSIVEVAERQKSFASFLQKGRAFFFIKCLRKLFYRNRFRKIARLIHIRAAQHRHVIGQKLHRDAV